MKPFISTLLIGVFLTIALILFYVAGAYNETILKWAIPFILIFSIAMAAMNQSSQKPQSPSAFVTKFMGTIVIKLFSALIFLTIALYINKSWEMKEKIILSSVVFLTYIAFTIFMGKDQSRKNTHPEKGESH